MIETSRDRRGAEKIENQMIGIITDPADDSTLITKAQKLANDLALPVIHPSTTHQGTVLAVTPKCIEIRPDIGGRPRSRPVRVDLHQRDTTSPAGRSTRQPIARALGGKTTPLKKIIVADATAGLGEDTWLMASLGCRVIAIERSPIIAAMLADGLRRAAEINPKVAERITIISGDAKSVLPGIVPRPHVVYLDPMFPPKRGSALESKRMRVLRTLVGNDDDAIELLEAALSVIPRRVVVKRPLRAPELGGKPAVSYKGKSLRYDVYPQPTL